MNISRNTWVHYAVSINKYDTRPENLGDPNPPVPIKVYNNGNLIKDTTGNLYKINLKIISNKQKI